jgi:hypothetical protein
MHSYPLSGVFRSGASCAIRQPLVMPSAPRRQESSVESGFLPKRMYFLRIPFGF